MFKYLNKHSKNFYEKETNNKSKTQERSNMAWP
jgi:hypothetical protein